MQHSLIKPYVVYGYNFHHGIPLAEMEEMLFYCLIYFFTVSEVTDQ